MAKDVRVLEIFFSDASATFSAGSEVSGGVVIVTNADIKAKAIKLNIHGLARCHWDEKRAYTKGSASTLSHKDAEIYVDETVILSRPDGHLPSGKHTHRFKVRVPPFAPASFDGQFGKVQYWAKVVIERPFGKENIEVVKAFNVKGILDLNADPDAKKAAENAAEGTPGLLCFKSGRISASLSVDRRSTAPGLSVPFTAIIKNESRTRIKSARIILSQQVTYKADKQIRRHSTPLKGVSRNIEIGTGTESWVGEITDVPPVVPSHLGAGCKFIDVRYILTLIVVQKGPGKDLEVPLEIVIGTVPLRRPSSVGPQLTVRGAIARASAGHLDVNDLREAVFRADKSKN